MTPTFGKSRSLLATARIANVPSVVSNVWVGIAIAAAFHRWETNGPFLSAALCLTIAGVLLYIFGNFLNDWHDREWDRKNRPERALPSGLFSPAHYLFIALACALIGLFAAFGVSAGSGLVAVLIVIFIGIYTRWHKRAIWPVIPMGLCRALLPVLGFVGISALNGGPRTSSELEWLGHPIEQVLVTAQAAGLLLYIAGLSLNARYESAANPSMPALVFSKALLVSSGTVVAVCWAWLSPKMALIGFLPFAVWLAICLTKFRRPIPVHVSALLAGIPFVDWVGPLTYALLEPVFHYPPALRPYLFACFLIPPLAFLTGRLLQRLAPAT
jgi:4-hydroxybenzoate polyprenyltransferase